MLSVDRLLWQEKVVYAHLKVCICVCLWICELCNNRYCTLILRIAYDNNAFGVDKAIICQRSGCAGIVLHNTVIEIAGGQVVSKNNEGIVFVFLVTHLYVVLISGEFAMAGTQHLTSTYPWYRWVRAMDGKYYA